MAARFDRALDRFIARCTYVKAVQNLVTKWRLELTHGYVLDVYYNETLGKYGYTLSSFSSTPSPGPMGGRI